MCVYHQDISKTDQRINMKIFMEYLHDNFSEPIDF